MKKTDVCRFLANRGFKMTHCMDGVWLARNATETLRAYSVNGLVAEYKKTTTTTTERTNNEQITNKKNEL